MLAPTDSLITNALFLDFFKGLVIRSKDVDPNQAREPGGIFQFDPTSDRTELILYYTDAEGPKTYAYDLSILSERYHRVFQTDVSGRLYEQIIQDNSLDQPPYGAIQAGSLTKLFVGIPGMKSLDPAGINRAELLLPLDPDFFGSNERFEPPSTVLVGVSNEAGTGLDSTSLISSSASYDPLNQRYAVPLTNNLQRILADRLPDTGFIIIPDDSAFTVNRAIFAGPGHPNPDLQPKFKVVYTSLPGGG